MLLFQQEMLKKWEESASAKVLDAIIERILAMKTPKVVSDYKTLANIMIQFKF